MTTEQMRPEPFKVEPGSENHLTLLMAADSLNLVVGPDRALLLRYGARVWQAAIASQALQKIAEFGEEQAAQPAVDLHESTAKLVNDFAVALAKKLAVAEKKYGYSDGWMSPDWMDECRAKLLEHVAKGDPRDVAAYCAFLWFHNESTASAQPVAVPGALPTDWLREADLLYRMDEHGNNHDEIKVAMAGGRRDLDNRAETARLLLAMLTASPAPPPPQGDDAIEFQQFLSDVLTAAGLVEHGKQSKALAERLADGCMKFRTLSMQQAAHGIGPKVTA